VERISGDEIFKPVLALFFGKIKGPSEIVLKFCYRYADASLIFQKGQRILVWHVRLLPFCGCKRANSVISNTNKLKSVKAAAVRTAAGVNETSRQVSMAAQELGNLIVGVYNLYMFYQRVGNDKT